MNRKRVKRFLPTIISVMVGGGLLLLTMVPAAHAEGGAATPDEPGETSRRKPGAARDFKLMDQYGREVQLSAFRGQYVHLDFSAVWCGPCHKQARYMAKLEKELEGYGFVSISIIVSRNPAAAKRWAKRYRLKHVLTDSTRDTKRRFGVRGYPTNIILRPDLRVAASHAGAHGSSRTFRRWLKRSVPEMFRASPVENNNARAPFRSRMVGR